MLLEETFPYLGARYSPWAGLKKGTEIQTLITAIKGIRKLCLKPWQKIEILQKYLLPRYIYGLTTSPPSQTILRALDRSIRSQVTEILHVVSCTATGFFYTPKVNWGLGLDLEGND